MTWRATEPYVDLPRLPPTAEIETRAILRATINARSALAALNQAVRSIPNPAVLLNNLPLLEAQASSEIENIVTTTDELFRYASVDDAAASPQTRETLRYRSAMFAGIQSIGSRPLSTTTAIEVCSTILGHDTAIRDRPGTYIGNPLTQAAIYTPPSGRDVLADLLSNWERFLHDHGELDPLIVMAVAHYQFEAIHPFSDGNGRTGRVLNVLSLVESGLIRSPVLYLSRYFIRNRDDYYRLLLEVTRSGDWESWIQFVLAGVWETSTWTLAKIDALHAEQERMREAIRDIIKGGANADLLDVLFENPYSRIKDVVQRCQVSRPTAVKWLDGLVTRGALREQRLGRERLFLNTRFIELLRRDEPSSVDATSTLF